MIPTHQVLEGATQLQGPVPYLSGLGWSHDRHPYRSYRLGLLPQAYLQLHGGLMAHHEDDLLGVLPTMARTQYKSWRL
jgi:hypothetical protein